jgi:hypothetical protein
LVSEQVLQQQLFWLLSLQQVLLAHHKQPQPLVVLHHKPLVVRQNQQNHTRN